MDSDHKPKSKWSIAERVITLLATVVLAIFALVSHTDTQSILRNDQDTKEIEFRAYLSVVGDVIGKSDPAQNPATPYVLNYVIANDGLTPAQDVSIKLYLVHPGGSSIQITAPDASINSVLDPHESTDAHDGLTSDQLHDVAYGNADYLRIFVSYQDYNGNSQTYFLNGQVRWSLDGKSFDPQLHTIASGPN